MQRENRFLSIFVSRNPGASARGRGLSALPASPGFTVSMAFWLPILRDPKGRLLSACGLRP